MSSTSPEAIVDAVMADLKSYLTGVGNPPKTTRSYAEAIAPSPNSLPLLAVWCEVSRYELLMGNPPAYERKHHIEVAWYVANTKQAEFGGVGDPQVVHDLAQTVETILARLETYTDGIPGLGPPQLVVTLDNRELKPQAGNIWRGLIELVADEAA